jgi:hypothetical protein
MQQAARIPSQTVVALIIPRRPCLSLFDFSLCGGRQRRRRIVMNDHWHSHWKNPKNFLCCKHGDSYATVTCGFGRHGRITMNRGSVHKVDRIIESAQCALFPAGNFGPNLIPSGMRNRVARPAFRAKLFSAASRNGQYSGHGARFIHDEKYLAEQVNFNVSVAGFARRWPIGCHQNVKIGSCQLSRSFESLDFLKGDQRIPRNRVPLAVNLPCPIAQFRQPLLGLAMILGSQGFGSGRWLFRNGRL